jgi:hypothetical protein
LALEQVAPEDKPGKEVVGVRLDLYMEAKKWDRPPVAGASHQG